MATLLLIFIYIAFISLGIPDSLFGAAWPAIYLEFGLPISWANFVSILIMLFTLVSSVLSPYLINKWGTGKITAISTTMTAAALFGFAFSASFWLLCLCAVPLGLGAGAIDSGLNNYIALHYKAIHMNFLHCFYGVGILLSPFLLSLAMSDTNDWRLGYIVMASVQLGLAIMMIVSLPLWKKVSKIHVLTKSENDVPPKTLSPKQIFKVPALRWVWGIFLGSCAIEYCCNIWGSTFLVEYKGVSESMAAMIITLYFVGLVTGRLASGFLSLKLPSWTLIFIGQAVVLAAIIVLFLPSVPIVAGVALFFVGFGNGPIYPNLMHLAPISFDRSISQSVVASQMVAAGVGSLFAPMLFGIIAQYVGVHIFPYALALLLVSMIVSTFFAVRKLKSIGKFNAKKKRED